MRKRTGKRYVPISISLPMTMINDIESELDTKQSRSEWIAEAIINKMKPDDWNFVENGDAVDWYQAFKRAMNKFGVKFDVMFWDILKQNCLESRALTDEHSDQ